MTPPWLWLYGPPGVGKSAIGYEVFTRLARQGSPVAYVELDQIGMCMPAPTSVRSAAKAESLLSILTNVGRAGVEGAVVSGDIAGPVMDDVLRRAPTRPVLCRLRADHDVIVERLTIRQSLQYAEASRTYDQDHVVPAGDISLTTHPLGIADLAGEVLRQVGPWPPTPRRHGAGAADLSLAPDDCSAVLVTGPRAVGKSTVAWQLYMRAVSAGARAGYLDLEQLSFMRLPPSTAPDLARVKVANIAACWAAFRRRGATRLVLCGGVGTAGEMDLYRRLFPSLHVVALTAAYRTILQRARSRARRKDIWLPGDDLFGRSEPELSAIAEQSRGFSTEGADVVVHTDGLDAGDVASRIACW